MLLKVRKVRARENVTLDMEFLFWRCAASHKQPHTITSSERFIVVGSSKWVLSLVGALTAIFVVFVSVLHLLLNRWVDEKKKQLRLLVLVRLRRNTCQSLCPKMIVYKHLAEAVSRAASMSVLSFAKRILFWIPLFVCSFSSPLRNTQQPWRALAGFLPLSLSLSVALLQNTTGWNCAERGCTNNVVNFTLWSLKCYSFSN